MRRVQRGPGAATHPRIDGQPGYWMAEREDSSGWQLVTDQGHVTGWVSFTAGVFACGYLPTFETGLGPKDTAKVLHVEAKDLKSAKRWLEGYIDRTRRESVVEHLTGREER